MATIRKFEDLVVWQKARELCNMVHALTLRSPFNRNFSLKDQIERSSGSTMDNIAEGFGRNGRIEFIHFLTVSMGSSTEVQSQAYRALDFKYISQTEFKEVYDKADECGKMLNKLIEYLNHSSYKGVKFKDRKSSEGSINND